MRPPKRETAHVRVVPPALVAVAAIAAAAGAHRPAFYLLLAAVPAAFTAGLTLFGDFVDGESTAEEFDFLRVVLHAIALGFVVSAAASARLTVPSALCAVAAFALAGALRGAVLVQDVRRVPREVDQRLGGKQRTYGYREAGDHAALQEAFARR